MSKTLRRPMFRGGPVNSRGTGITSGLDDLGYMDGGRVEFQTGGSYPSFRSPISTSRAFGVEPGYNLLDKLKSLMPDTRSMRQRREEEIDRIRSGIDTSGASVEGAIEFGNTGFGKDTPPPPPPPTLNIPTEITDEEELIKQTKLYQKLLGGDEAKSQAIFDALLAASPAFFKSLGLCPLAVFIAKGPAWYNTSLNFLALGANLFLCTAHLISLKKGSDSLKSIKASSGLLFLTL